jgi:hypothetical protein
MKLRTLCVLVCVLAAAVSLAASPALGAPKKHCYDDAKARVGNGSTWACVDSYTVNGKTVNYGDPGFNPDNPNAPLSADGTVPDPGATYSWGWNKTVYYGRYYPTTTDGANQESASFNLNGRQIQFRSSLTHLSGVSIYNQHVYWGCEYAQCGGGTLWGSSVSQSGYMGADVLYKPWFQWAFSTSLGYSYYNPKVYAPTVRCNSAYTSPCWFGS